MTSLEDAPAETPAFDALAEAKLLLRGTRAGSLATLDGSGAPFASLVTVATDHDGRPIILVSTLSSHTRHLMKDPRCSLLLARTGAGDPLAHARLTLTGTAVRITEAAERTRIRGRFLARHPQAELYADFGDFSFWRIDLDQAHLNGGFARAARFPAVRLLADISDAGELIEAEHGAVSHMNQDHADALALYAEVLAGQPVGPWVATGLDPEGMDLACGDLTARVPFPARVTGGGALRACLVQLAAAARARREAETGPSDPHLAKD